MMNNKWSVRWRHFAYACALLWGIALPISIAGANILMGLCLVGVLTAGDFREYRRTLARNPVVWTALALFVVLAVGMVYSRAPFAEAWSVLLKYTELLCLPLVVLLFPTPAQQTRGVDVWLSAMLLILGLSYFMVVTGIPVWHGTPDNAFVFKNQITHGILMALAAYVSALRGLSRRSWVYFVPALLAAANVVVFTQGRSGQVVLFALGILLFYQFLSLRWLTAGLLVLVLSVAGLYGLSDNFRLSIDKTVAALNTYEEGRADNSTAIRYEYLRYGLHLYAEQPLLGSGTGSFALRYQELVDAKGLFPSDNPHNEYLMLGIQVGLPGIVLFCALLGVMWRYSFRLQAESRRLAQGVVVMMGSACLLNSLLLDFTEGQVFAYLGGILFAGLGRTPEV